MLTFVPAKRNLPRITILFERNFWLKQKQTVKITAVRRKWLEFPIADYILLIAFEAFISKYIHPTFVNVTVYIWMCEYLCSLCHTIVSIYLAILRVNSNVLCVLRIFFFFFVFCLFICLFILRDATCVTPPKRFVCYNNIYCCIRCVDIFTLQHSNTTWNLQQNQLNWNTWLQTKSIRALFLLRKQYTTHWQRC